MLYIGIDLGTSSVKLILMDEGGRLLKTVSREYSLIFPKEGWAEQEPREWKKAVLEGLAELTADCEKTRIAAMGVGGQMHGLVVLDSADRVLRPAILWNDGRTGEETEWLNERLGRDKLDSLTGNIAFAGFTAPKLLWMRKHEPEKFALIHRIMLPKDYISYILTGEFVTDYSDASGTLLLDVENRCWSREMLSVCGIGIEQLPRLCESYEVIGTLRNELAHKLGLPTGIKLVAGAGDNAAAAVGTATVGASSCNISLGTSGTVFISSREFIRSRNNALHSFCHADGGFHLMGCMLSAASCNKWWSEEILRVSDFDAEQEGISREGLGRNSVLFLPYLMGERAPHNDALARGAIIGLSLGTTREQITQAVLEGVAFGLRDSIENARAMGISVDRSMLCGGGARSPLWRRILANVLNIRLELPETEQGPGYGAAILAAVGDGAYPDVYTAAKRLVKKSGEICPEPELSDRYEQQYIKYKQLYPALRQLYHE